MLENAGFTRNKSDGNILFYRSVVAGALSGAFGAFVGICLFKYKMFLPKPYLYQYMRKINFKTSPLDEASPFYLVKTRLQSRAAAAVAVGFQHKHVNLTAALKDVYTKGGFLGLWAGVNAGKTNKGTGSQLMTH